MEPIYISDTINLNENIYKNINKKHLLIFTATWCGPCKILKKELFDKENPTIGICNEYSDQINVVYIDVDTNDELSEMYNISSLPTQVLIKLNEDKDKNTIKVEELDRIEGYDIIKLRMSLEKNIILTQSS
jgi:thioredoxin 1